MNILRKTYVLAAAFCLLAIMPIASANAQLGGGVGGLVGGVVGGVTGGLGDVGGVVGGIGDATGGTGGGTGGLGGAVGILGGPSVSVGDSDLGATAAVNDGSNNTVSANLGVFSGLLNNTVVDDSNLNATIGLPGLTTVNVNQNGTTLGVNLGLPTLGTPTTTTTTPTTTTTGTAVVAGLTDKELAKYKIRCRGILSSPGGFDKDLVSLCRMIAKTTR